MSTPKRKRSTTPAGPGKSRLRQPNALAQPTDPKTQEAQDDTPVAVASTHRQIIPTGTVAEVSAILPPVEALEADDLDIAEYHHQYSDKHVEAATAFIDRSGVADYMEKHHHRARDARGRRETIPFRAIMVALWLVATDGGNLWMTNVRDVLFHKISPRSRSMLGITYPDRPTPLHAQARNEKTGKADRDWDHASEKTVGRTFRRMLATIDPSIHLKNRVWTWQQLADAGRPLSERQQQIHQARLDWVCNRLLETAFKTLPRDIRRKYKGSACIDATPLPLFSVGRGKDNTMCSSDPDGGYYARLNDHREPDRLINVFWALDVSLVVAVDCHHGDRQYLPALPIGMTTDRPGMDPSGAARRIFAYLSKANYPMRWLAGDLLYTDQLPEKFQTPAREVGYKPVLGYGPKHHGRQGAHTSGMVLVEGNFYCPAMPAHLIDATVTRRTKNGDGKPLISHEQWKELIDQRGIYLMRQKAKPDPQGDGERLGCPASGAAPLAVCPLKPNSAKVRRTKQRAGVVADVRLTITVPEHLTTGGHAPKVCEQDTISIKPAQNDTATDRYRQELQYGSVAHLTTYVRLRQAQEGLHGFTKQHAAKAFADANSRRVRGKAAQSLFAALLLAAASIAKIRAFLHTAKTDTNGDRWVKREPLVSALRTPPGDEAPEPPPDPPDDPDPDDDPGDAEDND